VQLAVTRCNTVHCTSRSLRVLATLPMSLDRPGGFSERRLPAPLLRLTLDAQDRPAVLLRDPAGHVAHLAACTTAACDDAPVSTLPAPEDGAAGAVLLTGGDGTPQLVGVPDAPWSDPIAAADGDTVYGLGAEPLPARPGLFGMEKGGTRLVLWRCPADVTQPSRRVVLPLIETAVYQAGLAVAPDGRVLVTYADDGHRYAMLVTGAGKETKGAYCQGFAG
jgi:hypothetical protein